MDADVAVVAVFLLRLVSIRRTWLLPATTPVPDPRAWLRRHHRDPADDHPVS